ncbi:class C sortase [Bifidobacterium myosotis]|uniref:Class C sortase n=1 Tax=Bifidobacterium myosotis TaxID=1630166 RepID=A0A5M9ZHN6_9BIFI|nr:class C sortase [Bifidobacterium myosotis]KAA8826955.1 class C sortase [Bifidobacterium myosotis]
MRPNTRTPARAARHAIPAWMRRRWRTMRASAILILTAALILAAVSMMQALNAVRMEREAAAAALLPTQGQRETLEKAREYNERLSRDGQTMLGEVYDAFGSTRTASEKDRDYQSALDVDGSGLMGSVSIPKIGIRLPVYHGTAEKTLLKGAGHMYGTSLPVGGKGTHAVVSAHNGLPDALMFTHLDELEKGDVFRVTMARRTLAYRATDIRIVLPTQWQSLKIQPGRDLVTLMTCTPYGVNTHRLLVTGERIPDDEAPADPGVDYWGVFRSDPLAQAAAAATLTALAWTARTGRVIRSERRIALGAPNARDRRRMARDAARRERRAAKAARRRSGTHGDG